MKKITLLFIFLFTGIVNAQTQVGLDINGEASGDQFGTAIAHSEDGNIVVVGAYNNDGGGSNSGSVRVFQNISGVWTQLGQDIDGMSPSEQFGYKVSLSDDGTILAASAVNIFSNSTNEYVKVFRYQSGNWQQIGQTITEATFNDAFGISISLSSNGTRIAVGKKFKTSNGLTTSGAVSIYENISDSWIQVGQEIEGVFVTDNLGSIVELSGNGNIVAVSSNKNSDGITTTGRVEVFYLSGSSWLPLGLPLNGEFVGDNSGSSVSLSSDGLKLAIGEPYNDTNGLTNSGRVKVYEYVSGTWSLLNQILYGLNSGVTGENFGTAVSLSSDGNVLAVGAPFNSQNGNAAGRILIFQNLSNNWQQVATINGLAGNVIGNSINLSGDGTMLGSSFNPNKVKVFDLSSVLFSKNFQLNNQISIYPNPVQDILNVEIKDAEIANIEVLSLEGKQIITTTNKTVNTSNLTNGMYLIKVYSVDGKVGVKKIIK